MLKTSLLVLATASVVITSNASPFYAGKVVVTQGTILLAGEK